MRLEAERREVATSPTLGQEGGRGQEPRDAALEARKGDEADSSQRPGGKGALPTPWFQPGKIDFEFLASRTARE